MPLRLPRASLPAASPGRRLPGPSPPNTHARARTPPSPVYHVTADGWKKLRGEDVGELHYK